MAKPRKSRARKKPAAPPPFGGDHGTGTHAAASGTVVEELKNDDGSNPNRMARRRRLSVIDAMTLTMRQEQAARAIEKAWCCVLMLESGGPLEQKVDASPKPGAIVTSQLMAQDEWSKATAAILRSERALVFHVCCENRPIGEASRRLGIARPHDRFKQAMDRVADFLRY